MEKGIAQNIWEMSDQKAHEAVIYVMSKIWKLNPSFEPPYLEPSVEKNDILALIREEEEEAVKKVAEEEPQDGIDLNE